MAYSSNLLLSARDFFKHILVLVTLGWLGWIWIFKNPGNLVNLKISTTGQLLPQHLFFLIIHYFHTNIAGELLTWLQGVDHLHSIPWRATTKTQFSYHLVSSCQPQSLSEILKLAYTRSKILAVIAINSSYFTFKILGRSIYIQKYVVCTRQIGWHWKFLYLAWIREDLKNCIENQNKSTKLPHFILILHLFHLHIQDSLHGHKYFLSIKILFQYNF